MPATVKESILGLISKIKQPDLGPYLHFSEDVQENKDKKQILATSIGLDMLNIANELAIKDMLSPIINLVNDNESLLSNQDIAEIEQKLCEKLAEYNLGVLIS